MLFLPIVWISTFIGNATFFNSFCQLCLGISGSLLGALVMSHVSFFILFFYIYYSNWVPMFILIRSSPLSIEFIPNAPDYYVPFLISLTLHWWPIFQCLYLTPSIGRLGVYCLSPFNFQEKVHVGSQRFFYLVSGFIISTLLVHTQVSLLHPYLL